MRRPLFTLMVAMILSPGIGLNPPFSASSVCVVGDVRRSGFNRPLRPGLYLPCRRVPSILLLALVVRASVDPLSLAEPLRREVRAMNPELPLDNILLMRAIAPALSDVDAGDPASYALISVIFLGAALLACYLPARRIGRLDPSARSTCFHFQASAASGGNKSSSGSWILPWSRCPREAAKVRPREGSRRVAPGERQRTRGKECRI